MASGHLLGKTDSRDERHAQRISWDPSLPGIPLGTALSPSASPSHPAGPTLFCWVPPSFWYLRLPSTWVSCPRVYKKSCIIFSLFPPRPWNPVLILPVFSSLNGSNKEWGRFKVTTYIRNRWHQLLKPKVFVKSSFKSIVDWTTAVLAHKLISGRNVGFKAKFCLLCLQRNRTGSVVSCRKGYLFVQL